MITFLKDKSQINSLMKNSVPIMNIRNKYVIDYHMDLVSWHVHYKNVDINKLKSKTDVFTKILGQKQLAVKTLGSDGYKNYIWIITTNNTNYIFYLSLKGLSIEIVKPPSDEQILTDIGQIFTHFQFKKVY